MPYDLSKINVRCKGDVVAGDTIMWTELVEKPIFSVTGKVYARKTLGARRIVAKVVKESYGAKKQQHTFTLMVIYSDGPMPVLTGERIYRKGRVIYNCNTLRKAWDNEASRQVVKAEKNRRGLEAQIARELRLSAKLPPRHRSRKEPEC